MSRFIWLAFFVGIVGWFAFTQYQTPCRRTLHYSIGRFDTQFGESKEDFVKAAAVAESVWEEPTGFPLFQYDPKAKFAINLIYDERQQVVDSQNKLQADIADGSGTYDEQKARYDTNRADYDRRVAVLKTQIAQYNAAGGAPANEVSRIEAEQRDLNALADQLNALAKKISAQAKTLNVKIDAFNMHVGHVFDQAEFNGTAINIYEFENQQDLILAMAHELGHALGLKHVDDPKAIMYYLLQDQDVEHPQLKAADLSALKTQCTVKLIPHLPTRKAL